MLAIESFPYIANTDCHTLILGTMPGKISLAQQRYYAHPRNAFWPIIGALFDIDPHSDYSHRTVQLAAKNIAVWDVLQSCVRAGSLDAAIETTSIVPNDIAAFLNTHRAVQRICFNGATAAKLFRRHVQPLLGSGVNHIEYLALPSTSPAHAGMRYEEKLRAWRVITA
jgi:TDG/mug DNA glycosylase family protein